MIELNYRILRALTAPPTQTLAVTTSTQPTTSTVDINDTTTEMYCGVPILKRFVSWFSSQARHSALQKLKAGDGVLEFHSWNGSWCFYIRANDKRRGLYSDSYATQDEAAADVDTLLTTAGFDDTDARAELIRGALNNTQIH